MPSIHDCHTTLYYTLAWKKILTPVFSSLVHSHTTSQCCSSHILSFIQLKAISLKVVKLKMDIVLYNCIAVFHTQGASLRIWSQKKKGHIPNVDMTSLWFWRTYSFASRLSFWFSECSYTKIFVTHTQFQLGSTNWQNKEFTLQLTSVLPVTRFVSVLWQELRLQ